MRRPVIAGNWKLFKTRQETASFITALAPLISKEEGVDIIIAPVFTSLSTAADAIAGTPIKLAAQDCYWEDEGAFTGEVSPRLLLDAGCSHVIIGHSERRQFFGETDETVNKKIHAASVAGLTVLFCIGETLAERESGSTFEVLNRQLVGGLQGISATQMTNIIIAYEPVWAIGTGKTASNDQAQEAHLSVRTTVTSLFSKETADSTRILYGGSVKPENICALMEQPDIDGALVGGASLKPESFAAIVQFQG